MKTNTSNKNSLFLIDTEASVSLIKIGSISNNIAYNKNDIIKLVGIAKTPILSIGSFNLKFTEQNVDFEHKFHLVPDDFLIPSNGIIGKDFIKRFKCLIDYGEMKIMIRKPNACVTISIQSELLTGVSPLPPRSETFKIFYIKSEQFPCVIQAQELEEGIVVPTTIAYEEKTWIRVLNTHENIKIINTESIKTSPITDFHVLQIQKNDTHTTNRVQILQNTLKKKAPEFMRNKIIDLCTEFSDIFHVEGDKCTTNNFYEQKLILTDNEPIYTKNYRLPHTQKTEINKNAKILLLIVK